MTGWIALFLVAAMLLPGASGQQVPNRAFSTSTTGISGEASPEGLTRDFSSYLTTPNDMPPVTILTDMPEATEGCIFMAPYARFLTDPPYQHYLLILDSDGELVYHKRVHAPAEDFKKVATGELIYTVGGSHTFWLMDDTYDIVEVVTAQQGWAADFHDVQVLADDHILLLIYEERVMDMSQYVPGGNPDAVVVGCRLQELDADRQVIFDWTSFDHFDITDTSISLLGSRIDYAHCNSVERDLDGNLIISSRDLDEVSKINWDTGEVMWRLGGKRNEFTFVNAAGAEHVHFVKQHDARRVPNGNITVYDNHSGVSAYSRAVEYEVDEVNKVATLVWEYRASPDIYGYVMGNVQRQDDGTTIIGWGSAFTTISEINSAGDLVFELALPQTMVSYRAFKYPWTGRPDGLPYVIERGEPPAVTLTYSWNGATGVSAYRVYGDISDVPTTLLAVQPRTGFEDSTVVTDPGAGTFNFRVVPVDETGRPMIDDPGWSPTVLYLPLLTTIGPIDRPLAKARHDEH